MIIIAFLGFICKIIRKIPSRATWDLRLVLKIIILIELCGVRDGGKLTAFGPLHTDKVA